MRYAAKKTGMMLLTMLLVSLFTFFAFSLLSGDAAERMLGTEATPERLEALRSELGLDQPLLLRYGRWLAGFVRGDFGTSYQYNMPVRELIGERLGNTLVLTLMAFVLIVVISVPLGVVCGKYAGGRFDRVMTVVNQIVMTLPPFFTGILLSFVFGLVLNWFVSGALPALRDDPAGYFGYLFFPAISVALPRAAMSLRLLRGCILDEARRDYVRTSMSRGRSRGDILYRHVLKNTLVPLTAFLASTAGELVAGSIVVEQVFSVPGLGRLLLTSISNRDVPVVQAVVVLIALWVVVCNLIGDLVSHRIDPRISFDGEGAP